MGPSITLAQTYYTYPGFTSPSYTYPSYTYPSYSYPSYGYGCMYILTDLSYGSRGSEVLSLQQFLVNQGYPGTGSWMLTGYFGDATQAALRTFQASRGFLQSGVADAATRAAIMHVSCLVGQGGYPYSYQYQYPYTSYPYGYQYPYQHQYQYPYTYPCTYPYSMYCDQGASVASVTGPNSLPVGATGTWTLNLTSYGNQYITTSVRWGDEHLYGYSPLSQMQYPQVSQTLTFTHSYAQRGTYTIVFTVRGASGRENTASATVYVY